VRWWDWQYVEFSRVFPFQSVISYFSSPGYSHIVCRCCSGGNSKSVTFLGILDVGVIFIPWSWCRFCGAINTKDM
jgi:hypothetical protein